MVEKQMKTFNAGNTRYIVTDAEAREDIEELQGALSPLEVSAESEDVGKALKAKTISGGKVTEYELGYAAIIDDTLSVAGEAADAKETGDAIADLDAAKVNKPTTSPNGTSGQLLRTNGDGTTTWVDQGLPTDAQTADAVSAWLDDHPEATTTVQDGAITKAKLDSNLQGTVDDVDDLKSTLGHKLLADYQQKAGTLGASGTWVNVGTSVYKHIVVPVKPYDIVAITANSLSLTRIGFVKSYTVPSANTDVVDYSSQTGFTARILINANTTAEYEVPSDANYIIIDSLENGTDSIPVSCVINDADFAKSLFYTVSNVQSEMSNKADWNEMGIKPIESYEKHYGLINSSGVWGSLTSAYQHVIIHVKSGDKINIEGNESLPTYIAFLKSYILPVANASANFSEQTGFTARIPINANTKVEYEVPSDANYIYYLVVNNNNNAMPKVLAVNSYNIINQLVYNLAQMQSEIDSNKYLLFKPNTFPVSWESGTFTSNIGSASSNQAGVTRQRSVGYYRNEIETMLHTDGTFTTNLVLYTDSLNVESKTEYDKNDKVIPANKYYRILIADGVSNTTDISGYTSDQINTHISISNNDFYDLINPDVKWCAMGDSITEGFVSYRDENGNRTYLISKDDSWVYKLARIKKWEYTNLGIGGTGWNKATNAQVQQGIDTTSAHYVARHTDFSEYNLVTLSYGINDWKANYQTGSLNDEYETPTTTIGGMRATIDAILDSNPYIKIIVILPLNTLGYYSQEQQALDNPTPSYGTYDTDWGLGHSFSNSGTLEQFVQAMISVCDYYGIQYIDQTHYSVVNRNNIKTLLTDGVHPNAGAHTALAKELSAKITFN